MKGQKEKDKGTLRVSDPITNSTFFCSLSDRIDLMTVNERIVKIKKWLKHDKILTFLFLKEVNKKVGWG